MQPLEPEDFHVYMTGSGPRGVIYVGWPDLFERLVREDGHEW